MSEDDLRTSVTVHSLGVLDVVKSYNAPEQLSYRHVIRDPHGGFSITAHDALRRIAVHEASHASAALTFGIPIIAVIIDADTPHLHRGNYQPSNDCGLDCIVTMCLAGPSGEETYCNSIPDGSDESDIAMARHYLAQHYGPVQIGFQLNRLLDSAQALVRLPTVAWHIRLIADALLRHGTLSGGDILQITACN